jgi:dienelactone hydrolase
MRISAPLLALLILASASLSAQAPPPPSDPPAAAALPKDLQAAGREFVDLLVQRNFIEAAKPFTDQMKAAAPPQKLAEIWNTIQKQFGAFKKVTGTRVEPAGQHQAALVTAEFANMTADLKVVFDAEGKIAGFFVSPVYTPPSYAKEGAFEEKEVVIGADGADGAGEWALPATLALPAGAGPFPAVVLVHGSGPHDRDETIGPNKPFKDLASGLASQGIAVLRYEKRTKKYASKLGAAPGLTVQEETVDDALAAVALLRGTPGIDAKRIFVLGHSLGGMLIPRIGQRDPGIAGLIVLAGATRPLEDLILEQISYISSLDGTISAEEKKQLDEVGAQVANVKGLKASTTSAAALLGYPATYWFDLQGYQPASVAKTLKQPLLILQGERDYQVTMEDFDQWKAALADRKDVTLKSYPTLNHLFMEGTGKAKPEEYGKAGHVALPVITDVAGWIGGSARSARAAEPAEPR